MSVARSRLPAAERRAALIDAGLRVFAGGSYSGATTAEIARRRRRQRADPLSPLRLQARSLLRLPRRDVVQLKETAENVIAAESDPREWPFALARAMPLLRERGIYPTQLWMQALGKAGEDPELRRHVRRHMRDVHEFGTGVIKRAQEAGGVSPDRDPSAEAWISLGIGLLRSVQDRLGGLLGPDDFSAILSSRRRSLTEPD